MSESIADSTKYTYVLFRFILHLTGYSADWSSAFVNRLNIVSFNRNWFNQKIFFALYYPFLMVQDCSMY